MHEDSEYSRKGVRRQLFQLIAQQTDVALLAPRFRGKRSFLQEIHQSLEEQVLLEIEGAPHSVYLELRSETWKGGTEWDRDRLLHELYERVHLPLPDSQVTDDQHSLMVALMALLDATPGDVVLLISPIEALSDDLARDLLIGARSLPQDHKRRLILIVGGSHSLEALSDRNYNSPFNTAYQLELPPLSLPEFRQVVEGLLQSNEWRGEVSDVTLSHLWKVSGGEPLIVKLLLLLGDESRLNVDAVDRAVATLVARVCEANSGGPPLEGDFASLQAILDDIAAQPGWLLLVSECLGRGGAVREHAYQRSPTMSIAFRRTETSFRISCSFFECLLAEYFNDRRLADSLVLCGEWSRAKPFYERSIGQRPYEMLRGRERSLTEVTFFAFERVFQRPTPEHVIVETLAIARLVIGADTARLFQACYDEHDVWQIHPLEALDPEEPESEPGPDTAALAAQIPRVVKLALKRQRIAEGAGGHVVAVSARRADNGKLVVLCLVSRSSPIHDAQKLAARALVRECASALAGADARQQLEREKKQQKQRLEVATSVTRSIQEHLEVGPTAEKLLEGLRQLGYPLAMISLLDTRDNIVRAVAASEPLAELARVTERPMGKNRVTPEDDILVYVIKTGKPEHVANCEATESRCNYAALAIPNPNVVSQIVLPLQAARGVGWQGGKVFGTLQIINPPHVHPDQGEQEVIDEVVAHASVGLANAILFREREQLARAKDLQIRLLEDSATALADVQNIDLSLQTMLKAAVDLVGGYVGSIRLYDENYKKLVYRTCYGPKKGGWTHDLIREEYEVDETSTAGWVFKSKRSRINSDVVESSEAYRRVFHRVRSNCGVMIRAAGEDLGVLVVDSDRPGAFDQPTLLVLETIGLIIGALIKTGEDYRRDRARAELVPILSSTLDWKSRLEQAVELIRTVAVCEAVSLFLRPDGDDDRYYLTATTSERLASDVGKAFYTPGLGATGWVAEHGVPLRVRGRMRSPEKLLEIDAGLSFKFHLQECPVTDPDYERVDYLACPIMLWGVCVGVIRCLRFVEHDRPESIFSHYDEQVLKVAAEEIENALRHRSLEEERDAKARALAMATGMVAHRIKNPLFGLSGGLRSLHRLLEGMEANEASEELIDMEVRVKRIEAIIQNFVELASPAGPRMSTFDIFELLKRACQANVLSSSEHVLEFVFQASPPAFIKGDPEWFHSVLEELIGNAFRVMPESGRVCVELSGPHSHRSAPFPKLAEPYFLLTITDSGPGVAANLKSRIFEPFFTQRAHGSGLGLALVKKYCDEMGWAVREDGQTREGHGARFRIGIPAATEDDDTD